MKIMPNRMDRGFYRYQKEFEDKALEVLRSGWYVLGKEVSSFEEEFASYVGTKYCVGVASGLDALWIAFKLLHIGEGDEVLVQGNTYIASVMGITMNGATPVFIEPDEHYGMDPEKIEQAITDKTKAVLVTHLYGMASKMDEIVSVEDMPNKMGNYTVIGQIVIEKIGVSKYILDKTTNNALDLSVTKFKGPEINKVGNFCITGHNYKGIFKRLNELEKGDEFYLIGKDGRKVTYVIYDKFSINPENEECLSQQTNGKREVTLITCDPGAVTRLILKADEKI